MYALVTERSWGFVVHLGRHVHHVVLLAVKQWLVLVMKHALHASKQPDPEGCSHMHRCVCLAKIDW